MGKFDFISDDKFRQSLENDYSELVTCLESQAWKSAHVVAGSIIEAILIDYLLEIKYKGKPETEILKMDLGVAILACKEEKILTEKTEQLSAAVKSYRNLIHPARIIRLNENVGKDEATIAKALVDIIIKDIAIKRQEKYGYTAEQIIAKLDKDSSVIAILGHLLKEMREAELEKLLIDAIPKSYIRVLGMQEENWPTEYSDGHDYSTTIQSLKTCFRLGFDISSPKIKKKITQKFISLLKEGEEYYISEYEIAFFRISDLEYLDNNADIKLVKDHILYQLPKKTTEDFLKIVDGIGEYLELKDINKFLDPLIKIIINRNNANNKLKGFARILIEYGEYWVIPETSNDIRERYLKRIGEWIEYLEKEKQEEEITILKDIKNNLITPLPF